MNGVDAWLSERSFETALKLAVAARTTPLGWLGASEIGAFNNYHQVIRRLKRDLQRAGVEAGALVENNRSKQYRFSVPPRNITIDEDMVCRHSPESDMILSGLSAASGE